MPSAQEGPTFGQAQGGVGWVDAWVWVSAWQCGVHAGVGLGGYLFEVVDVCVGEDGAQVRLCHVGVERLVGVEDDEVEEQPFQQKELRV